MKKREVIELAHNLFLEHGLQNWKFKIYNRKRNFGTCFHSKQEIALSKYFIKYVESSEQVKQILLHEIAHALCDIDIGHGYEFKQKCMTINCIENMSSASFTLFYSEEAVYNIICPKCGVTGELYKKTKRMENAIQNNSKPFRCRKCRSECSIEHGAKNDL